MFKRMCDTIKKAKTKKEKDAPKNHESVIGECIRLKDSNVNVSILLLFPPDPLHQSRIMLEALEAPLADSRAAA